MPFEDLPDRLSEVRQRIDRARGRGGHGQMVRIIAVTKTHGPDAVEAAFKAGVPDVGENRVQEALGKMAAVSSPVQWHLIGHLQRNKVNTAGEDSKGGFDPASLSAFVPRLREMEGIDVRGVMTMAPLDAPAAILRQVFAGARAARSTLQGAGFTGATELSMGMSGDYEV